MTRRQSPSVQISVIVPAYGAPESVASCLEALSEQSGFDGRYEVILIDDGSPEPLSDLAERYSARCFRQRHQGPAAARNLGAEAAFGEILAFTDSDCVPSPAWLEALTAPLTDPEVVGVKGSYISGQAGWVPRFVQLEYEAKYRRMARQPQIDFVDTYSAAYRRTVFIENGGFDESFPVPSVEDQEFSFRLARKGYRMVFAPEAVVAHQHDESLIEYARRKFNIGYWKAFLLRWLPEKMLSDSHTLPVQRWQIGLLALAAAGFVGGAWWMPGWIVAALAIGLFFGIDLAFLGRLIRADLRWLLVAPVMLVVRAAALGLGLAIGWLLAPQQRATQGLAGLTPVQRLFKRSMDVVGASVGLVLTSPILAVAAAAVKLQDGGEVFFRQTRIGEGGRSFQMLKLRTMVPDAEAQLVTVLDRTRLVEPVFKIPDDPRTTRVGRVLRRWSLDELPQLWNVLVGEMSLVGPRPEEAWVVAQYNDAQRQRLAFKPGLTGPMQINGRGGLGMEARLALELDYIHRYSLIRDLAILAHTLPAVVKGEGAF